jgi:hypothetical protein
MTTLTDGTVITEDIFNRIITNSVKMVKDAAPNPTTREAGLSTGNLAFNAVRKAQVDRRNMRFVIYVDTDIAPYMKYVEEKTNWSDGRPYEYYHWFDNVVKEVAEYIADIVGGKVIKS